MLLRPQQLWELGVIKFLKPEFHLSNIKNFKVPIQRK
jgi:hypothetical protein